jgi:hypothetical protein
METKTVGSKMVDVNIVVREINATNKEEVVAEIRERYLKVGWEVEATHFVSSNESGYKFAWSLVKYE